MGDGLVVPLHPEEEGGHLQGYLRILPPLTKHVLIKHQRLLQIPPLLGDHPQATVRQGGIPQRLHPLEDGIRPVQCTKVKQHKTIIAQQFRTVRGQLKGLFIEQPGRIVDIKILIHAAHKRQKVGILGVQNTPGMLRNPGTISEHIGSPQGAIQGEGIQFVALVQPLRPLEHHGITSCIKGCLDQNSHEIGIFRFPDPLF